MSTVTPQSDQAAELLQKLSLDSPKKTVQAPEPTKKTTAVQYAPIDTSGNGVNLHVERSISPFMDPSLFYGASTPYAPEFMDQSMFYNQNRFPSHTYYYGGNEWDGFVNSDGTEIIPGVYGDYQHGYSYMPYGAYSPSGSSMGHDGQLYGAQQYQYPTSYFQPSSTATGPYAPNQSTTSQAQVSPAGVSNQLQLPANSTKGNHGSMENAMSNQTNISKPISSNYQNSSLKSSDFYGYGGLLPASSGISSAAQQGNYGASGKNQNSRNFSNTMGYQNARATSGFEQPGFVNKMYPNSRMYGNYANVYGSGPGFLSSSYYPRANNRGLFPMDNKYRSRNRNNGVSCYSKDYVEGLNELNKGPRTKSFSFEDSEQFKLANKGQSIPLGENANEDSLPIFPGSEDCNKDDFPEAYADAKFFVIKSYSEDDVHKSIKYGVWTSTVNGNKKLDAAYKEAQGKPGGCPVFLLFSVNASAQFVGLAEMIGPVEFEKTVDYWQQDKWHGCFPVKWHIIKDVPNSALRHIKLENNDNKAVTNSRDTQEVSLEQGIQIIKIFKSQLSKTCILDDFEFYEGREKVLQDKKARQRQYHKQGTTSAEELTGKQPSDRCSDLASDLTEEPTALVSGVPGATQSNGGPKLLEDSPVARGGRDASTSVHQKVIENNGS